MQLSVLTAVHNIHIIITFFYARKVLKLHFFVGVKNIALLRKGNCNNERVKSKEEISGTILKYCKKGLAFSLTFYQYFNCLLQPFSPKCGHSHVTLL